MKKFKTFLLSNNSILVIVSYLFNFINLRRIKTIRGNNLIYSKSFLKKTSILLHQENNEVHIMPGSFLKNCSIFINGRNNKVIINENCRFLNVELHIEDDNNNILIGKNTTISGNTHLACIEGTNITIGEDCMLSKDIVFRTGDSHSIVDENCNRINPSKDIFIGNHVWIGNKVIVTKGVVVEKNSIIGTGSIVTKKFEKPNIIIAGTPAVIIKENINWLRERI